MFYIHTFGQYVRISAKLAKKTYFSKIFPKKRTISAKIQSIYTPPFCIFTRKCTPKQQGKSFFKTANDNWSLSHGGFSQSSKIMSFFIFHDRKRRQNRYL